MTSYYSRMLPRKLLTFILHLGKLTTISCTRGGYIRMGGSHFSILSTQDKPVGRLTNINSGIWFTLQARVFHQNDELMKL